jgi:hypothetical protein
MIKEMDLQNEHTFINFQKGSKTLQYVRENYLNRNFCSKTLSIYDSCDIIGYTLNEKQTKIIRIFYNKHGRPEGDRVVETVLFSSIKVKKLSQFLHN